MKKPKLAFQLIENRNIFAFTDAEWAQLLTRRDMSSHQDRARKQVTDCMNSYCLAVKSSLTQENLHYELSRAQWQLDQFLQTAERLDLMFAIDDLLNIDYFRSFEMDSPPAYNRLIEVIETKVKLADYLEHLPPLKKGAHTSPVFITTARLFTLLHDDRSPVTRSSVYRKEMKSKFPQGNTQGAGSLNDLEFFELVFSIASRVSGVQVDRSEIETALKEVIRRNHDYEDVLSSYS